MSTPLIAITADKGIPKIELEKLAKQTSLPLANQHNQTDYLLHITTDYLELCKTNHQLKKSKIESIHVDFVNGKANYRRLHGGGKGQDIAKAIGLNKIKSPCVLDLTAGMGGDAFVLATLGADVTMIERNRVVHALLNDAIERASLSSDSEIQAILRRFRLINQSAIVYLDQLDEEALPDIIYLDPMFPSRKKSAQAKKEMSFFHEIVGQDEDSEALLVKAMKFAKKRIVVKRPRLAEALTDKFKTSFSITGKSTRYDIYLPQ